MSTKLSGLQVDTEYTFQLVLRTTAGVFPSNLLRLRTHAMSDTSGVVVCFGNVQDPVLLDNAKMALREMGAKWYDKIQIDTTHFVCTTPAATPSGAQASGGLTTAPGVEYQKALQLTIPIVQPHWILACHSTKKYVIHYSLALRLSDVGSGWFPFTRTTWVRIHPHRCRSPRGHSRCRRQVYPAKHLVCRPGNNKSTSRTDSPCPHSAYHRHRPRHLLLRRRRRSPIPRRDLRGGLSPRLRSLKKQRGRNRISNASPATYARGR